MELTRQPAHPSHTTPHGSLRSPQTTIEATRDVLKEVLVHWDVNPELMLVELRPVVVAVGEFWGSMGEDKFLKMASDNPSARHTDGGGQYRARPGSPDVGHGLTFGILHYANVTFQMGYSVEDVVRGVERSASYWRTQGKEGATREDVFTNYDAIKWVVEGEGVEGRLEGERG